MTHTFKPQPYTKRELALLYFPQSTPQAAVNHLMTWIKRSPALLHTLRLTGYRKTSRYFTPRQVEAIVSQLGEP